MKFRWCNDTTVAEIINSFKMSRNLVLQFSSGKTCRWQLDVGWSDEKQRRMYCWLKALDVHQSWPQLGVDQWNDIEKIKTHDFIRFNI